MHTGGDLGDYIPADSNYRSDQGAQAEDAAKAAALKLPADEMEIMERRAGETPLNVIRYW